MSIFLGAQTVQASLVMNVSDAEIKAVKSLIDSSTDARSFYNGHLQRANTALSATPNPVKSIISEGRLASDPAKIKTVEALKDMGKIDSLTFAYLITKDKKYLSKARSFILAWANKNKSDGNAINETKFEILILAYSRLYPHLSLDDRKTVNSWLVAKAKKVLQTYTNDNWESHRLSVAGMVAYLVRNADLLASVKARFKSHLNNSFNGEGVSNDFYHRDALHYHLYSIEPLLNLACYANRNNEDMFSYQANNGASLKKAVDFVVPYARGEKTHTEFLHTQSSFDRRRAAAGEAAYIPHTWTPSSAISAFVKAGCLSLTYNSLAKEINKRDQFATWIAVLNKVNDDTRRAAQPKPSEPKPVPKPSKPTPPASKKDYVIEFGCSISNNNNGCQKTLVCNGTDIMVEAKVGCFLESVGSADDVSDLKKLVSGLFGDTLLVARKSDIVSEGKCFFGSAHLSSGSIKMNQTYKSSVKYGCSERDKRTGGDCRIYGKATCRPK